MLSKSVTLPLQADSDEMKSLRCGEPVYLSGYIYSARDAAHAKFKELLKSGCRLPMDMPACIYYAGPCPAAPGEIVGPCGPTTSSRMDPYTPMLIDYGLTTMIGKGARSSEVKRAMKGKAVYFAATGGAGLLIASCIRSVDVIAFPELGAEAVRLMRIEDMPAIVAIDYDGNDLYNINRD